MLAIVDDVATFITGEYEFNQQFCCKNTRNSYISQDKDIITVSAEHAPKSKLTQLTQQLTEST